MRRSAKVGTYRGKWAGVSGYLEVEDAAEQMWTELGEELGIARGEARMEVAGESIEVLDERAGRAWLVHPFRLSLGEGATPRLDWEHVEMRWILPHEMRSMETVPGLWDTWTRVAEGFDRGAGDRA